MAYTIAKQDALGRVDVTNAQGSLVLSVQAQQHQLNIINIDEQFAQTISKQALEQQYTHGDARTYDATAIADYIKATLENSGQEARIAA